MKGKLGVCLGAFLLLLLFITPADAADKKPALLRGRSGNPQWYQKNLYQIYYNDKGEKWIESKDGERLTTFETIEVYKVDGRKKLKLTSKLGFTLRNIPIEGKNSIYFYNECIAIFLEGEKLLPKAKQWLEDNGFNSSDLDGLDFRWPDKPFINKENNETYFEIDAIRTWWKGEWRWLRKARGFRDFQYSSRSAIITYGYNSDESIIIHEYLHICGYFHKDVPFKKGSLRATYK